MGITKDGILRLDERTKEIMQTWPLEQVKRWAATQNIFTIDFGDYSEGFYSVQTPDGDKISEIVAGYIDLIAKNKKNFGPGGMGDGTTQEPIESDGTSGKKGATQIVQGSVAVSNFNNFVWNMDLRKLNVNLYLILSVSKYHNRAFYSLENFHNKFYSTHLKRPWLLQFRMERKR